MTHKIAFRLNSPEKVEYANAHRENDFEYELCPADLFHLPMVRCSHVPYYPEPGYTDVTDNFKEDYWKPWKDGLASVQNREVDVVATFRSSFGITDEQLAEILYFAFKSVQNAYRLYPENKHTFSDHKEYLIAEAKKILTPKQ